MAERVLEKTVLCCVKERRREVKFSAQEGKSELLSLIEAVKSVFSDVVLTGRLTLQQRSEDWEGEFLDIQERDTIPNHAVVRCVVEKPSPSQVKARVGVHMRIPSSHVTSNAAVSGTCIVPLSVH